MPPGRRGVSAEGARAWADDLRGRGRSGEYFFSLNRYMFQAHKARKRTARACSRRTPISPRDTMLAFRGRTGRS